MEKLSSHTVVPVVVVVVVVVEVEVEVVVVELAVVVVVVVSGRGSVTGQLRSRTNCTTSFRPYVLSGSRLSGSKCSQHRLALRSKSTATHCRSLEQKSRQSTTVP